MQNHFTHKVNGKLVAIYRKEPAQSLSTIINKYKRATRDARLVRILATK